MSICHSYAQTHCRVASIDVSTKGRIHRVRECKWRENDCVYSHEPHSYASFNERVLGWRAQAGAALIPSAKLGRPPTAAAGAIHKR